MTLSKLRERQEPTKGIEKDYLVLEEEWHIAGRDATQASNRFLEVSTVYAFVHDAFIL